MRNRKKKKKTRNRRLAAKRWASNEYMKRTSKCYSRRPMYDSDSRTFLFDNEMSERTRYYHISYTTQAANIFHRIRLIIIIIFPFCIGLSVCVSVCMHRQFDTNTDILWWERGGGGRVPRKALKAIYQRQVSGRSAKLRIVFLLVSTREFK